MKASNIQFANLKDKPDNCILYNQQINDYKSLIKIIETEFIM